MESYGLVWMYQNGRLSNDFNFRPNSKTQEIHTAAVSPIGSNKCKDQGCDGEYWGGYGEWSECWQGNPTYRTHDDYSCHIIETSPARCVSGNADESVASTSFSGRDADYVQNADAASRKMRGSLRRDKSSTNTWSGTLRPFTQVAISESTGPRLGARQSRVSTSNGQIPP